MSLIVNRSGSRESASRLIHDTATDLGMRFQRGEERALLAVVACRVGVTPETVAKQLSWREFENFCAHLLRAWGYQVRENLTFTKPRVQIDLVASSDSLSIVTDCKHWTRPLGYSALARYARAQIGRAKRLREELKEQTGPIVSSILTLCDEHVRFVEGVAIVPLHVLRGFLESVDSCSEILEFA